MSLIVSSLYFGFIPNIPGQAHFRDATYPSAIAKPSSSRCSLKGYELGAECQESEETIGNSSLLFKGFSFWEVFSSRKI